MLDPSKAADADMVMLMVCKHMSEDGMWADQAPWKARTKRLHCQVAHVAPAALVLQQAPSASQDDWCCGAAIFLVAGVGLALDL